MGSREADKDPLEKHIDDNLKRIYDETLKQPLPDKLQSLLAQLRKGEETK